MSRIRNYFNTVFSFDLRSLALFRIFISTIALFDLWSRSRSLLDHYTDDGVLPRSLEATLFNADRFFSFHNLTGSLIGETFLFSLHAICVLSLLVGFRTRLATFLCWIFLVSLENRNSLILNAGDTYLRMLLFWGMFLPLGARASIDATFKVNQDAQTQPERVFSAATVGLTLQIVAVYFFSGLTKLFEPAWIQGFGVYFALSAEAYTTSVGKWVGSHRDFLLYLNPIVLWFEVLFCILLFIPIQNDWFRRLCILLAWGFHISIAILLEVGLLSEIGVVAWMVFIPSSVWNLHLKKTENPRFTDSIRYFSQILRHNRNLVYGGSILSQFLATLALMVVILINLSSLPNAILALPDKIRIPASFLRLDQDWSMFRSPIVEDGWFTIPGILKNNSKVDLYRGGDPYSETKPPIVSKLALNDRWRIYTRNLYRDKNPDHFRALGNFYCREWNQKHSPEEQLITLNIIYIREDTLADGGKLPPRKILLWSQSCF